MTDEETIKKILQLISNNETERHYFFQRLGRAKNPFEWWLPLKERGYLDPSKNPKPSEVKDQKDHFIIPHWEILDFVLNVAQKNSIDLDSDITKELILFVDSIIDYNKHDRIDNYRTDWILLKIIVSLPFHEIKVQHVNYISEAINSKWGNDLVVEVIKEKILPLFLENYPNSHVYLVRLIEFIWQYKKTSKTSLGDEYSSLMESYWLQEMMDKFRKRIAEKLKEAGANVAENIIRKIIKDDLTQFNLVWITHIDDNEQNKFIDRYEIQLTFFLRDCLIESDTTTLKNKIDSYLCDTHPIFKRLAIYCINKRYDELQNIFWNVKNNPLEYHNIKHELYPFFVNHAQEFKHDEIDRIIGWIESKDYSYLEKVDHIYYRKKEWLNALLTSSSPRVKALYEKYNSLNPHPLDHPGLDFWTSDVTFDDKDVETPLDLCERNNKQIAEYFLDKVSDDNRLNYSLIDDYAEAFKKCVLKNPQKILKELHPFLNLHLLYKYELLRAVIQLWQDKKEILWANILVFIEELIKTLDYKHVYNEDDFAYRDWVVSAIADLLEDGTKNDSHAFTPELLPISKKILLELEDNVVTATHKSIDLATSILNSTRGKIYSAIINYSLRYARIYKKEMSERFDKDVYDLFEKRLNERKEDEYFYTLGKFLANLFYLDKSWIVHNINKIFIAESKNLWIYAMSGYLFYADKVYKEIYSLLKDKGHLSKAIDTDFLDKHIGSRLIQHICISYLNKWENLTDQDALMNTVLSRANYDQLKEVIHFIWTQHEFIKEKELHPEIKALLLAISKVIGTIQDEHNKNNLLSDLARWIVYVEKFDPLTFDVFMKISKHSSDHFNTTKLVEGLSEIVSESANEVSYILLSVIENDKRYPYYSENIVVKILDELKKCGLTREIKSICNLLMNKGLHSYGEILRKYLL